MPASAAAGVTEHLWVQMILHILHGRPREQSRRRVHVAQLHLHATPFNGFHAGFHLVHPAVQDTRRRAHHGNTVLNHVVVVILLVLLSLLILLAQLALLTLLEGLDAFFHAL